MRLIEKLNTPKAFIATSVLYGYRLTETIVTDTSPVAPN
jgi:hypothetical protein